MPMAASLTPSSLSLEGFYGYTSCGISSKFKKPPLDGRTLSGCSGSIRCRNPFLGSTPFQWLSIGHDLSLFKVSVAADYSDSVPDSSNYMTNSGYHPLEDLKVSNKVWETKLTSAETARTTVEANGSALLIFPGTVHSEPHEQISWAEFQYVVDDYGDIYFEIFDDANILEDPAASNPVFILQNALIGMDMPIYENRRIIGEYNIFDSDIDELLFDDDYFEVVDSEVSEVPVDWEAPHASSPIHPIYFAKCLTKVVNMEYDREMDHPSNGVSILGCLRPTFADEESYIRRLFRHVDGDEYLSDWSDGEILSLDSKGDRSNNGSTLYRLEILRIELFSVYGFQACTAIIHELRIRDSRILWPMMMIMLRDQEVAMESAISLQDFQDAEPDFLVHSTSAIVERFIERGIRCDVALKALCKKKGLLVEVIYTLQGAGLIGVDSLGMDVRVSIGREVQTHRFPFKVRATSEVAAEKQIQQLLFPRSRRKKLKSHATSFRDPAF
ncbi:hypothetical protein G4B88_015286 [Cannabis sativa]|uniref:Pentatricopeptide repeat (PPR) superfamily protein n=1 Tax=Cannabis sativa TaxID=3483 RepID=A0A7J6ETA2_CANSA|nr:hypothetical protein G4B88_015286 [Cannabis sativa]